MPSCRHSDCDSNKDSVSCENSGCDSCDGIRDCRHNRPETRSLAPGLGRHGRAVTGRRSRRTEISSADDGVVVRLPAELPRLTSHVASALLAILVELTEVPVLDRPGEGVRDDR